MMGTVICQEIRNLSFARGLLRDYSNLKKSLILRDKLSICTLSVLSGSPWKTYSLNKRLSLIMTLRA